MKTKLNYFAAMMVFVGLVGHAFGTTALLQRIAPMVLGRGMTQNERKELKEDKSSIEKMLKDWTRDSFFSKSIRYWAETSLATSGERDGINFNLPGNLVEYVVRNNRPLNEILTADYCINQKLKKRDCDTQAPFGAGVVTTRAYMVSHNGSFNLRRGHHLINLFLCQSVPLDSDTQPLDKKEILFKYFQVTKADEAPDDFPQFGNGEACYFCHAQFAPITQPFVKFDRLGMYIKNANGQIDLNLHFGQSTSTLYASHYDETKLSSSEASQYLGKPTNNLAEAMQALTKHKRFKPCLAKNLIEHFFQINSKSKDQSIPFSFYEEISENVNTTMSFSDFIIGILTHSTMQEVSPPLN